MVLGGASAAERPPAPAAPVPAANDAPVATDVRLAGDDRETRLVMDLSRKIGMRAFTLADPYRVVIDIPQIIFQLPPKTGETGRGLIKAFRFGLVMQGGSRIVIDLASRCGSRRPSCWMPATASRRGSCSTSRRPTAKLHAHARARGPRRRGRDRKPSSADAGQSGDPRPLMVIDPGHGGLDNGTGRRRRDGKEHGAAISRCMLRDRLERPANTAWS